MAHTETQSRMMESPSFPDLTPSGFAALGKKNVEEFAKAQSDLLSAMQDAHRHWFDRMQSEAKLASEFTRKVTSCRSIPDAVAACQEWTGRRLELMADDSKHFLSDSRKVMEKSVRFLSDGFFANPHDSARAKPEAAPGASSKERVRVVAEPVSRRDVASE